MKKMSPTYLELKKKLVQRDDKDKIFDYLTNPDSTCLSEELVADPEIPFWVFSTDPPEESPTLHLSGGRGKIAVWSNKHLSTYINGVGYLVKQGSHIGISEGPFFGGGDMSFSSCHQGMAFQVHLTMNDWKKKEKPCRCHLQVPPV